MPELQSGLIIDDDPVVAEILVTPFDGEARITSMLIGPDGDAVPLAGAPDLIPLDVRMSDMGGYVTLNILVEK